MYSSQVCVQSTGIHQVKLGFRAMFKPWFFDGSIVFWGGLYDTESEALEQAEMMKRALL